MEREISKIYREANEDISKKWDAYMKSHEPKVDKAHADLLEAIKSGDKDEINKAREVYEHTVKNVTVNDKRFRDMRDEVCEKMTHVNEIAVDVVNGNMPKIYTNNYNAFGNEHIKGYSFALTNENAVKNLIKTGDLSLYKHVDVAKDMAWNEKYINSQVLQGILQGESIPDISKRIFPEIMSKGGLVERNLVSATRIARTMTTVAENKGRQDSFKKAQDDGVIMEREWVAAHDERTRAWHLDLDGVRVGVDEPWENEYGQIMYPGDPSADGANVYNCRCGIRVHVKGFKWNESTEEEPAQETPVTNELHTNDMDSYAKLLSTIDANGIDELPVEFLQSNLSDDEIINKLAGGDMTKGSCVSLSLAYMGNKSGLDVTDFRGGASQSVFSRRSNIDFILNAANAKTTVFKVKQEVKEVTNIIKNITEGKEYFLVAGRHGAIIRKSVDVGLEYLEMQSGKANGWMPFERTFTTKFGTHHTTIGDILHDRFGCTKSARRVAGTSIESFVTLSEVDSVQPTKEFQELLGYINTATNEQKKGSLGHER